MFRSDIMSTSSSASIVRNVGSDMPITVDGAPVTDRMNGAARPSTVNAPATCRGSPLATYASISCSLMSAANSTDA